MKQVYADKFNQEEEIKKSNLNWVIVRPTQLVNKSTGKKIKVSIDGSRVGSSIFRGDVATFLLNQLESSKYLHKTVLIGA